MNSGIISYHKPNRLSSFKFLFYKNVPRLFFVLAMFILIYSYLLSEYIAVISSLSVIFTPILTLIFLLIVESWNDMKKEENFSRAFGDEMILNLQNLKNNLANLQEEQKMIANENKIKLYPLHCVNLDVWEIFNQNVSIGSFKINYKELNNFVFNSRKYNDFVQQRSLIPIRREYFDAREILNVPLIFLNDVVITHLVKVLASIGKLYKIKIDDLDEYKTKGYETLIEELSDEGLKNEEILNLCREYLEKQPSSEPCELIIVEYLH